jgi:ABC-type transporter Mla subunit MlaD
MATTIYKPRIKTRADRILFFSVAVGGAFLALAVKMSGTSDTWKIWAPLLITVSFQIFYATCVMIVPLFRLREDRAGDSFYYLGLLYTLASLAYTLAIFRPAALGDSTDATNVISGFGVALATTIVGLGLRVFVQQFRSDPTEIENEARNTLIDVATTLTAQVHAIVNDMQALRQGTRQVIEEGMKQVSDAATASMTEVTGRFAKEIEVLTASMKDALQSFVGSAQQLSKVSQSTVNALSKLADRIDDIEPPSNVVEMVFGPARDGMKKAADSLTEAADGQKLQIQRLGELVTVSVHALQGMQGTLKAIEGGAIDVGTAIKALGTIGSEAANVTNNLANASKMIDNLAVQQKQTSLAIDEALRSSSAKMAESATAIAQSHTSAINTINQSGLALSEASTKHTRGIETELEKARTASAKLVGEVVNMADAITAKLSR